MAATAGGEDDAAAEWERMAREDDSGTDDTPVVDSPSISTDWPNPGDDADWPSAAQHDADDYDGARPSRLLWLRNLLKPGFLGRSDPALAVPRQKTAVRVQGLRLTNLPSGGLPTACAAMGALVLALVIWRADVVRLLPQTAAFYRMVGLDVNLRGLMFKDVKITTETVEGKPVLVIEGVIVGDTRKPVELPRLRFSVRDAQAPRSTPGMQCWSRRCSSPAKRPGSSPGWRRRRRKGAISTCASSTNGIFPAATRKLRLRSPAFEQDGASMPRVLIADDEDSMRTLVARAVAMDGHTVVTAQDGAEALEILSNEQGAFDLLLTDIQMPVMDGIALALTAARDFPDLTILLMTGFADQRERASGLNAIVHDVVTKPFSVAGIREAVAGALAARKKG